MGNKLMNDDTGSGPGNAGTDEKINGPPIRDERIGLDMAHGFGLPGAALGPGGVKRAGSRGCQP
jgi:hypothetical protein